MTSTAGPDPIGPEAASISSLPPEVRICVLVPLGVQGSQEHNDGEQFLLEIHGQYGIIPKVQVSHSRVLLRLEGLHFVSLAHLHALQPKCTTHVPLACLRLCRATATDVDHRNTYSIVFDVQLHIYFYSAADMNSLSQTCQGMYSLVLDPHLAAQWLLKCQPTKAMWLAAEKMQSTDIMLQLLHLGASPAKMYDGRYSSYTPLKLAAMWGHPKVVEVLLQNHDVRGNVSDAGGALFTTIERGDIECLKALLVPHSPVHANSRVDSSFFSLMFPDFPRSSPLHAAASCPNRNAPLAAKVLIEHGGVCTARDSDGQTPLHMACVAMRPMSYRMPCNPSTQFEVVRTLLSAPGGPNALAVRDSLGRTPLHVACGREASSWVIDCLLGTPGGLTALSAPDNRGQTPLHSACGNASSRIVPILLDAPGGVGVAARVAARDHRGQTPLHAVCGSTHCRPWDQVDVVRALLNMGGLDVIDATDNQGRTPLRLAAENAVDCCEVLLHAGSKALHIPDSMGLTPVDVSFGGAKRLMLRWK
eukprot:829943-Pelagomonas_calceolata.AAC.3